MLTLKELIDFADHNEIDYNTDLDAIVNIFKSIKNLRFKKPCNSHKTEECKSGKKINAMQEKFQVQMEKEQLKRFYDMCFTPKVVIGKRVADAIYDAEHFVPDNTIIIGTDLAYIGYFDYENREDLDNPEKTEQNSIKVFVDSSDEKNSIEALFHCYESYASKALKAVMPEVEIQREVCR